MAVPKSRGRTTTKRRTRPGPKNRSAVPSHAGEGSDLTSLIAAATIGNRPSGSNTKSIKDLSRPAGETSSSEIVPVDTSIACPITARPSARGASGGDGDATHLKPMVIEDGAAGQLQVGGFACAPLDNVGPQGMALTYWFDAKTDGKPYSMSIRFAGKLSNRRGNSAEGSSPDQPPYSDSFEIVRTLDPVLPGSGRIAFTSRVQGLAPGEWQVSATPTSDPSSDSSEAQDRPRSERPSPSSSQAVGITSYGLVANVSAPGARLGAWPALVTSGAVVALVTQALLASNRGLPVVELLLISLVACLAGLAGARMYYLLTHRAAKMSFLVSGMCIQGFVIVAVLTFVVGGAITDIPIGPMLDVIAPGLLLGMSIGRLGCFFGGCCAGRPSTSRWAVWSSDRTIGVRRLPVQLVESTMSGLIGVAALVAAALAHPQFGGTIFLAAIAANTLGRQLLFPMRNVPRSTAYGRPVVLGLSGITLVAAILLAAW